MMKSTCSVLGVVMLSLSDVTAFAPLWQRVNQRLVRSQAGFTSNELMKEAEVEAKAAYLARMEADSPFYTKTQGAQADSLFGMPMDTTLDQRYADQAVLDKLLEELKLSTLNDKPADCSNEQFVFDLLGRRREAATAPASAMPSASPLPAAASADEAAAKAAYLARMEANSPFYTKTAGAAATAPASAMPSASPLPTATNTDEAAAKAAYLARMEANSPFYTKTEESATTAPAPAVLPTPSTPSTPTLSTSSSKTVPSAAEPTVPTMKNIKNLFGAEAKEAYNARIQAELATLKDQLANAPSRASAVRLRARIAYVASMP